jgi:predicted DNA-binding transcriptional regulator AlpA
MQEVPFTLSIREVAKLLGVSVRSAYVLEKAADFPKARELGPRTKRFVGSEVAAWLASQRPATWCEPAQMQGRPKHNLGRKKAPKKDQNGGLDGGQAGATTGSPVSARPSADAEILRTHQGQPEAGQ